MKRLIVPFLDGVNYQSPPDKLLSALAMTTSNKLEEVPWPAFSYRPDVYFKLAYTNDCLLLDFVVREKHVKAVYRNTNDPVYKDSCVEFFLSFDAHRYYNLEFNCAGIGLIGYGDSDKEKRKRLQKDMIEKVRSTPRVLAKADADGDSRWELLLTIPFVVFDAHSITSFAGRRCTGNFYKCGDELPIPHYLSWNPINHPTPNFHLPQFFGDLHFQ